MSVIFDTEPQVIQKHPAEVLDLQVGFSSLLPAGASLVSVHTQISDDRGRDVTSSILAGDPTVNIGDAKATVRVRGGTSNVTYAVFCLGLLSNGERRITRTLLQCVAGPNFVEMSGIGFARVSAPAPRVAAQGNAS